MERVTNRVTELTTARNLPKAVKETLDEYAAAINALIAAQEAPAEVVEEVVETEAPAEDVEEVVETEAPAEVIEEQD